MDELAVWSEFSAIAQAVGARGCTADQLELVRLVHGVTTLPPHYEAFLSTMGVDQGKIFVDDGVRIMELRDALQVAETLCEESGVPLPAGSLVIGSREGYQFLFIAPDSGEVFCWTEWDNPEGYLILHVADSIAALVREEFDRFLAGSA